MSRIIRVCDLETTGLTAPEAAPCEVGAADLIETDDGWVVRPLFAFDMLCNPSRPIPPEVSAVHHIVDADVMSAPFWPEALARCAAKDDALFSPNFFAAHNAKFERQWFSDDVTGAKPWICTYKCALRMWPEAPAHNNQALRYWLKPEGIDRQIAAVAHRAFPDAYVTAFILREMLARESIDDLVAWTQTPTLLPKIRFGKHAGKKWSEAPTDYLQWVLRQDFDEDVLHTANHWVREATK